MTVPKINSAHGSDTRNIINRAIDSINVQGKSIQDLVAEGQLTEEQYAELLTTINGLLKSGNVDKSDLTPEFKGEIEGFNTQLAQKATKIELTTAISPKADKTYVDTELGKKANQSDIDDRGINLKSLGFKLDGSDELDKIKSAFLEHQHLKHPGGTLGVRDTLFIPPGCSLIGMNENIREVYNDSTPIIKYVGTQNRKKSVVVLGQNDVGDEPTKDASNIRFKNIYVDADYLAGFSVYATYIVNETYIQNIVGAHSLEYNFYIARGWYATIRDIFSMRCKGKGIALGMPLEYQSGETVDWVTSAPLELNNILVDNIRSIYAGQYYAEDNEGTYTPHNANHRRKGYGIGAGIGNSFNLQNYTSEGSGGANLYVYNAGQPIKKISNGYLELAGRNSGLANTSELPNIIIENLGNAGDEVVIDTVFMNPTSGGIYHVGGKRKVKIKNAHQPQFLKSLSDIDNRELWSFILKENVYYQAGYSNTNEQEATRIKIEEVNTRYNFTVDLDPIPGGSTLIYLKSVDGADPYGVYRINYENGNMVETEFPRDMNDDEWTLSRQVNGGPLSVSKGGNSGDVNAPVIFKVVKMPATN